MELKSDLRASNIDNYHALFTPCYYQNELHIAIRSYSCAGLGYYVLVNPYALTTIIVLIGDIQHRKTTISPQEIGYYTKREIEETPYGIALKAIKQTDQPIVNAGITHSLRTHESNQVFLTIDLCPSKKLFETEFFEKLSDLGTVSKPLPIAICITEFWRILHQEEFCWLLEKQREGVLQITWVNHSATHVYYHDRTTPVGLQENFLLDPRTNLIYELFEIEKSLIMHGQLPSVFFRAPGLVTDEKLIDYLDKIGLITLGADAWLAKDQSPVSGSFILVHGNSNEPQGIAKIMTMLMENRFEFLPLQQAFPARSEVMEYLAKKQTQSLHLPQRSTLFCSPCCNISAGLSADEGEQTDEDAVPIMLEHIEECISDKPIILQKPYNSLPGTRVITANHFNDPAQRLTLFRHLKSKDYAVKQLRAQSKDSGPGTTDIEVMLPTVTNR